MTELQLAILDFEASHPVWKYPGAREAAIRARLGISATRYAQVLNHLLDHPAAVAHAPGTVYRLQGHATHDGCSAPMAA